MAELFNPLISIPRGSTEFQRLKRFPQISPVNGKCTKYFNKNWHLFKRASKLTRPVLQVALLLDYGSASLRRYSLSLKKIFPSRADISLLHKSQGKNKPKTKETDVCLSWQGVAIPVQKCGSTQTHHCPGFQSSYQMVWEVVCETSSHCWPIALPSGQVAGQLLIVGQFLIDCPRSGGFSSN